MESHKGFIALPLMGWIAVGAVLTILALGIALRVQTARLDSVKAEYAAFKDKVKAVGEEQERKAKLKEAQDAKQIKDAVTERDIALAKLRQSANTRRRELPPSPTAPAGSSQICFGSEAYNAALGGFGKSLERFVDDARRFAEEGDAAQIDAQTLLKGWPK